MELVPETIYRKNCPQSTDKHAGKFVESARKKKKLMQGTRKQKSRLIARLNW